MVPLIQERVTTIDHELTPAQSSCIHKITGAVVRTLVDQASGFLDHEIRLGPYAGLNVELNVVKLLFRSRTLHVRVMVFSIP